MRVLVQRVKAASVTIDGAARLGEIGEGLRFSWESAAMTHNTPVHPKRLSQKQAAHSGRALWRKRLPTCASSATPKVVYLSLLDIGGGARDQPVHPFADCRRGRRPSFSEAADPGPAETLVDEFRLALERLGIPTAAGRFGAHMVVS